MTDELQEAAKDLREFAGECWDAVEAVDAANAGYFSELAEVAAETGFTEAELTAEVKRQIHAHVITPDDAQHELVRRADAAASAGISDAEYEATRLVNLAGDAGFPAPADATDEEAGSDTDTLDDNFFDLEEEGAVTDPAIKAAAEVQARADLLTEMAGGVNEQVAEQERLSGLGSAVEGELMSKWTSGGEGVLAALNDSSDTDAEDV